MCIFFNNSLPLVARLSNLVRLSTILGQKILSAGSFDSLNLKKFSIKVPWKHTVYLPCIFEAWCSALSHAAVCEGTWQFVVQVSLPRRIRLYLNKLLFFFKGFIF